MSRDDRRGLREAVALYDVGVQRLLGAAAQRAGQPVRAREDALDFVGAAAPRMTAETIIAITVGTAMTIETSALRIASIEVSTGMNDGRITWRAAFTSGSRRRRRSRRRSSSAAR